MYCESCCMSYIGGGGGEEGEMKNTEVNKTRSLCSVSSQIIEKSTLPSLQYLTRQLHGTEEGRCDRNGLCSGSFLSI